MLEPSSGDARSIPDSGVRDRSNGDVVVPSLNLHLGVYPPHGRVRVAAPLVVNDEAVRLAVIDKLGWIRRQKAKFVSDPWRSDRPLERQENENQVG